MSVFDFDSLLGDAPNGEDELPLFGEEENEAQLDNENIVEGAPTDEGIKVEPKKRAVRNPRPRLTVETLQGPRGIHVIEEYFRDIKFKGKGYESQDLDEVLRRMQHWGHRMYPNYKFDDVLNTIERLGRKRPLQVHMSRYRLGMLENMLTEDQLLAEAQCLDDANDGVINTNEPLDEFDALLDQQIAMSRLDPRTPVSKKRPEPITPANDTSTLSFIIATNAQSTPMVQETPKQIPTAKRQLSAEQLARIEENKRLARERLLARKAQQQQQQQIPEEAEETI